jgi:putative DNA primase/helicase
MDNTRGLAREIGFLARFLVAWPERTQGRRMFREAPGQWPSLSRFHRRLENLLDHPLTFDDLGVLAPAVLDLDPEAKSIWVDFHNTVEAELAPGGEMAEARDVASKAGDNAARMAALFHTFEHGPTGAIGADHMRRAARIVAWHLFEARRFLNQIAVPEAVADALALEAWLVDYCQRERLAVVPCNHIQKFGPNRTRRKPALEAALNELEGAGRIRRTIEGRKAVVTLNPAIIKGGSYGLA